MKTIARCVALGLLLGVAARAQTPVSAGFAPLFDGRSLRGRERARRPVVQRQAGSRPAARIDRRSRHGEEGRWDVNFNRPIAAT
jgi:hypothetical protein